MATEIQLV